MNQKKIVLLFLFFFIVAAGLQASTAGVDIVESSYKLSLLQHIENWYTDNVNYFSVMLLMALENSFLPVIPTELIIPPAVFVACDSSNNLNPFLIVVFGTLGSVIGALICYGLSLWMGRKVLNRLADSVVGNFFMLSTERIDQAERWFNKYNKISVCVARVIPGIRLLISVPAGITKMNLFVFCFYTFLGSGTWNAILGIMGYLLHGQEDLIHQYTHELSILTVIGSVIFLLFFIVRHIVIAFRKPKKNTTSKNS